MVKLSRQINLAGLPLGGGAPVLVQSMTNTDTRKPEETLAQISRLAEAGCEVVRIAVPDDAAAARVREIVFGSPVPVIADIHFNWRLAVASIEAGVAGLRINPGNIGTDDKVNMVIDCARQHGTVMRIGVNSGSLPKDILQKYGGPRPEALAESALRYAALLERRGFYNFKLSLKSSSVTETIAACRAIRSLCDHPLHLGITEAGAGMAGIIKSSIGIGILLHEGIGDTIRVSLTGPPEEEVAAAWQILAAIGLRQRVPEIISCPTCGRTEIDIPGMVKRVEEALASCRLPLKIAVMGCVVNGPGEAREADLGVAGGRDKGVIFRKGVPVRSVRGQEQLMLAFLEELAQLTKQDGIKKQNI